MSDTYKNYDELSKKESKNLDYRIVLKDRGSDTTCISIHGGNIEPATSEISQEICGNDFNLYKFEGIKKSQNSTLHITSTRFDEKDALKLVGKSRKVLSIHGAKGIRSITYIGGFDEKLGQNIAKHLKKNGFKVATAPSDIDGKSKNNIVNKGLTSKGCQLEITLAQRKKFFKDGDLKSSNRKNKSDLFYKYTSCIKQALNEL